MDVKFDLKNKKNLITIGVLVFAGLLLFQFLYVPRYREAQRVEAEYKKLAKEISELYNFIGGQENLKENIVNIRKELVLLENAFPSEKEVSNVVKQLNEEAKRFRVTVRSLKPKNLFIYKDHEGRDLRISDYCCKCMPLTLNVEARYQALGEFLTSLETARNPMVSISKVDIEKDESVAPWIKAEIELNTFMLGK